MGVAHHAAAALAREAPGPRPVPDRLRLHGILCVLHSDIAPEGPLQIGGYADEEAIDTDPVAGAVWWAVMVSPSGRGITSAGIDCRVQRRRQVRRRRLGEPVPNSRESGRSCQAMSWGRTYRMPCRPGRSSTGPGDRFGQGGSRGSISAHEASSTIHGRVVTHLRWLREARLSQSRSETHGQTDLTDGIPQYPLDFDPISHGLDVAPDHPIRVTAGTLDGGAHCVIGVDGLIYNVVKPYGLVAGSMELQAHQPLVTIHEA